MSTKTSDNQIDTEKLREIIRSEMAGVLREFVRDPDFGLALQDRIKQRIEKYEKQGVSEDAKSLQEVKEEHS